MSCADKIFIDMCRDIIDNGTSTEGEKVRRYGRTERPHIRSKSSGWSTAMTCRKNFRR